MTGLTFGTSDEGRHRESKICWRFFSGATRREVLSSRNMQSGFIARASALTAAVLFYAGCENLESYRYCSDLAPAQLSALPARLSETGLYADLAADAVAPGVLSYRPQFELWSDGASKRRWISLPPGSRIDTSDMDSWHFPEGTKVWKEFSRDNVRIETRLLQRIGPGEGDWVTMAYLWNGDNSDAVAVPDGVEDARGTSHDVPAANECMGCHGGRPARVLGFSAIQLSHDDPPGQVTLDELVKRDLLTAPPAARLELQADADARAALGYLHANCGHCHNQQRPPRSGLRCFDPEKKLDFLLHAGELGAVTQTAAYRTAVGTAIKAGNPGGSEVVKRMSGRSRFPASMPPLASERVDDHGVEVVRAWIQGLR
jgi:hypothetical protein